MNTSRISSIDDLEDSPFDLESAAIRAEEIARAVALDLNRFDDTKSRAIVTELILAAYHLREAKTILA